MRSVYNAVGMQQDACECAQVRIGVHLSAFTLAYIHVHSCTLLLLLLLFDGECIRMHHGR